MSNERPPRSRQATLVCGLMAAGLGLFLVLFGFGAIPLKPRPGDAPPWIAAAAGLAFLLAGAAVAAGAMCGASETSELPSTAGWGTRLFSYLAGLASCVALAVIGTWVAFGPGVRVFGGSGMFLLSKEAGELAGRVVFGFGAALTWLIAIAVAVSGARKLLRRGRA